VPYTEQYIKELRLERRLFMLINLIAAGALVVLFYLITHQQHEIAKQTSVIQQQRYATVFASCEDQNGRHDHTIKVLNAIITKLETANLTKKQKRQLRVSARDNILLINALAPKRDCIEAAQKAVRPIKGVATTTGGQ
jgi:hypothetical protein